MLLFPRLSREVFVLPCCCCCFFFEFHHHRYRRRRRHHHHHHHLFLLLLLLLQWCVLLGWVGRVTKNTYIPLLTCYTISYTFFFLLLPLPLSIIIIIITIFFSLYFFFHHHHHLRALWAHVWCKRLINTLLYYITFESFIPCIPPVYSVLRYENLASAPSVNLAELGYSKPDESWKRGQSPAASSLLNPFTAMMTLENDK